MTTTLKVLRTHAATSTAVRLPSKTTTWPQIRWSKQQYRFMLLIVLVVGSALGVIYLKEINRQLLNEVVQVQKSRERLRADWGKLLLAEGVLAQQSRIGKIAQNELNMQRPQPNQIVMVSDAL